LLAGVHHERVQLGSDATCGFTNTALKDAQNMNWLLGLLANNGGCSPTHARLTVGPVSDTGSTTCAGPVLRTWSRSQGGACEKGSVEA
jgi:hypothetical protein